MAAARLAVDKGNLVLHEQPGEILRTFHKPVFRAAVDIDMRQFFPRHAQNELERIVGSTLLGRAEDFPPRTPLRLTAETFHADARIGRRGRRPSRPLWLARCQTFAIGFREGDGSAVAADRAEEIGVPQPQSQPTVAAHR